MAQPMTRRDHHAETTRRDILEYAASASVHQIDRGRGLIHNVKILGARSRNGGVFVSSPALRAFLARQETAALALLRSRCGSDDCGPARPSDS